MYFLDLFSGIGGWEINKKESDEKNNKMYNYYKKGYSLSEIAEIFHVTRQTVYAGFKVRGFKLRSKSKRKFCYYNNMKFSLRNTGYYARTKGKRELMHRYIYEMEIGKIPFGWDVHHKDGNKENNSIENLIALPKSKHASLFSTGSNGYVKKDKTLKDIKEIKKELEKYEIGEIKCHNNI